MFQKWEVSCDIHSVVKIQKMIKTFIQPWEDEMMQADPVNFKGFFAEMFFNHFSADKLDESHQLVKFLTQPMDEGTPSF